MSWTCGTYGGQQKCIKCFGGEKTEEVSSIGRSRCRWKCNIKIYLEEIGWGSVGMGTRAGSFDHGNIFGSRTCRSFLAKEQNLPKQDSVPSSQTVCEHCSNRARRWWYAQVPKHRTKY